jgi:RNA polymerase sigma factor (sigma-70 family)
MVAEAADVRALVHCAPERNDGRTARRTLLVEALFRRYRRSLLWYLARLVPNRADAEDVAQEAFMRLLGAEQLESDPRRARNYLFATATNLVRDNFRRKTARGDGAHVAVDDLQIEADEPEVARILDAERGRGIIDGALRDVPARPREAFLLYVQQELTYQSIALRLGVSKKTIERDVTQTFALCRARLARWNDAGAER